MTADSTSFATDLAELLAARRASEARLSRTRRARGSIRCASAARRGSLSLSLSLPTGTTREVTSPREPAAPPVRRSSRPRASTQSKIKPTGNNSCLALPIGGEKEVAAPPTCSRSGEENGTRPARRLDLLSESTVSADSAELRDGPRRAPRDPTRPSHTRRARSSIRCASVAQRGSLSLSLSPPTGATREATAPRGPPRRL